MQAAAEPAAQADAPRSVVVLRRLGPGAALSGISLGVTRDGCNTLKSGLELHDSRVNHIDVVDGVVSVHFSHAYIHKSPRKPGTDRGTGWSQEALLILSEVENFGSMPPLPNMISEGFLEVGGIKHQLIPLPFRRKVGAKLSLVFVDGTELEIVGNRPVIELSGAPIYLEEFP